MIPKYIRAAYYGVLSPLMYLNGKLYRAFRAPRSGTTMVHLGPGRKNYLPGWINADANILTAKCDLWIDLRHPLPFTDDSVTAFYSHHVIEHLPDMAAHFRDVFRCLKPGGAYRVAGPNGDSAIKKFQDGDLDWFGIWPDKRRSIGGRFENFIFCRGEHLTLLTASFVKELLEDAGFIVERTCIPQRETAFPELFSQALPFEAESDFVDPHTLAIECRKPEMRTVVA